MRLSCQQLVNPLFDSPEEVVDWMGMVQAQDYSYFRWAVGMRTRNPSLKALKESFSQGRILRVHLLRCTVQAVTPQDYVNLVSLCRESNLRATRSWAKQIGEEYSEQYYSEGLDAVREILTGSKSFTKKEIATRLDILGIPSDTARVKHLLLRGEIEGILCSGEMSGRDATWALSSEALKGADIQPLSPDEALAGLARKYFRSHSPASLEDFHWWTGLPLNRCRRAIESIASEFEETLVEDQRMFIHPALRPIAPLPPEVLLLPPYDEYLIGYKSRHVALDAKYEARAHNRSGNFWPVVLLGGRVVGNWRASLDRGAPDIPTDIFTRAGKVGVRRLEAAKASLRDFLGNNKN